MAQKWPKITQNSPKITQHCPKIAPAEKNSTYISAASATFRISDDKKQHHCDHWSVKSFKIEAIFWRKNLFLAAVLALLDKTWRWVIFLLGWPDCHIHIFLINIKLSFQNDFYREKEIKLSKHCRLKRPKHTWYLSIESARRLSMMT